MKWLATVLVLGLWGFAGAAQDPASSVVSGVVVSPDGRPLAGAVVAVTGTTRGDHTDARGRFQITGVPAGARVVRATFDGYREARYRLEFGAADTVRVALRLSPADPEGGLPVWPIDPRARPRAVPIGS